MKNKKYPASHKLAVSKKSYVNKGVMVQKCEIIIGNDVEREVISELHWKPISKIFK
ncbi:hypothetical protein [Gaetbulibacter jejuensis]|uniref:Uncharacterized protein n=1 Tax=Gaetbulibacter jejuensis TaxID=584607 RepID=A0ABN1JN02_9FLAO